MNVDWRRDSPQCIRADTEKGENNFVLKIFRRGRKEYLWGIFATCRFKYDITIRSRRAFALQRDAKEKCVEVFFRILQMEAEG